MCVHVFQRCIFAFLFLFIYINPCIIKDVNKKALLVKGLVGQKRISEIDLLRGIPIFLVVLFHFCWIFPNILLSTSNYHEMIQHYPNLADFVIFLEKDILNGDGIIHQFFVPLVGGLFIFVCGICTTLSRNNLKRALLLWGVSLTISLVTTIAAYIIKSNISIGFGVIHLMAFSITLYVLIEIFFKKLLHKDVSITICLLVSIIIYFVSIIFWTGYFPLLNQHTEQWPIKVIYTLPLETYNKEPLSWIYEAIGRYQGMVDWWPIFPYTGVVFSGIAFGKVLYGKQKKSKMPCLEKCVILKPLCFIGRHTLYVYLIHQPVIITILVVVFLIMGFKF